MDATIDTVTRFLQKHMERANNKALSEKECKKLRYGVGIVIKNVSKDIVLLFVSFRLGVLIPAMIFRFAFMFYRGCFKGIHLENSLLCTLWSFGSYGACIALAFYIKLGILHTVFIYILILYVICKYVPVGTEKNPILPDDQKPMKFIAFVLHTITYSIVGFLQNIVITNILILASMLAAITTLPIIYKVNNLTKSKKRKEG